MTATVFAVALWMFGLADQANEYRAIRRARAAQMTAPLWVQRRRAARASLVFHAVTFTLALMFGMSPFVVASWFVFSAVMWVVADVATPATRGPVPPARTVNLDSEPTPL